MFSFQAMYAGLSPYDALALYAVIAYMDSVAGVYFPRAACTPCREALAGGGREARRRDPLRRPTVTRVEQARRAARSRCTPPTASGSPADVVVLNPDLPVAYRELLGVRAAPAAAAALLAVVLPAARRLHQRVRRRAPTTRSTSGAPGAQVFDELIDGPADERPVAAGHQPDPVSDPSLAPAGRRDLLRALPDAEPRRRPIDWDADRRRATASTCCARSRRAGTRASATAIEVERVTTPADWAAPRHGARARRSRPRTRSARPGRSGRATCTGENVVFTGLGHPARRRRPDGARLRPAGRRARARQGSLLPLPRMALTPLLMIMQSGVML